MIITISGMIGAGKDTIAGELAKRLDYQRYSSGGFMRQMAKDRKMSLAELSKEAETNPEIDKEIDKKQIEFGKIKDNYVVDGRLSWLFMPNSIKIYLDVSLEEAAKRIFLDQKENRKVEDNSSLEKLVKKIKERKKSEIKRYKKYYGVDIHDKRNYNIYLNTTNMKIEDEVGYLIKEINKNF